MITFFQTLPRNLVRSLRGTNGLLYILAFGLTYLIVHFGFDWRWYLAVRSPVIRTLSTPALIVGGLLPIILPLCYIVIGAMRRNMRVSLQGWMLGQAALLGYFVSTFLKAFTGRIPPAFVSGTVDISHQFQFGFFRGGIFWGWPSSHTCVAFALSVCFAYIYRRNKLLGFLALVYALYIGLGVSVSIHWLSEFVAGALIGIAIGRSVGKNYQTL